MLPRRRKPPKMHVNEPSQIRCPSHLAWVRGHECAVSSPACNGKIEAAHVRRGTDGGTSVKPGDNWAIPLCTVHHAQQHQTGEATFEWLHKINMRKLAAELWSKSPHGAKLIRSPI